MYSVLNTFFLKQIFVQTSVKRTYPHCVDVVVFLLGEAAVGGRWQERET